MVNNKIVLLTGATDGIGKQAAFALAEMGAILLMHGKDSNKGEEGIDDSNQHSSQKRTLHTV